MLAEAGFIAAEDEARELRAGAAGDEALLDELVARRLTGEPLAWITGRTEFCGIDVRVDPGVYVPRPHTELLAERAAALLPEAGVAIDLCTGSGAIAKVLAGRRPGARVFATDVDERAIACARANGVDARRGDLFAPLPPITADVVTAVVPYVPDGELGLLQRDTFTFESALPYGGGPDGADVLRRVVREAAGFLDGTLLLELGAGQPELLRDEMSRLGYRDVRTLLDEDGDVRGVEAVHLRDAGSPP